MKAIIEKMRADFVVVTQDRIASGEWSAGDADDIGNAIRSVVESGDQSGIAMWARWLADLAAFVTAWTLVVRATEGRMREEARRISQAGEVSKT